MGTIRVDGEEFEGALLPAVPASASNYADELTDWGIPCLSG